MKLLSIKKTSTKILASGFTLIELLIVMSIIGLLAAAILATVDPFEQIKKGVDTATQNAAVEFFNASVSYGSAHYGSMPWGNDASCSAGGSLSNATLSLSGAMGSCLDDLINDGELKKGFTTVTNAITNVIVSGLSNTVTVCYIPQSKSGQHNENTKYDIDGSVTTGCISQNGAATCYWCTK